MPLNIEKRPGPLLIVDDRHDVRVSLQRFFQLYFEVVLIAGTPDEAEAHLCEGKPRYLLTDFWLGNDHPPATHLVPRWRDICPTLTHVALMTGTKTSSLGACPEVDVVFQKPLEMERVIQFFRED